MADIRYLNQFGMPGGFNITSDEPIDSREHVTDINHIYSEDNWKTVKPYNSLMVSAADGQVRICVDAANYTQPEAWKEVGSASSDDVTNIQQDITNIQNTINGTEENPGLISRVETLEGIDHTQYVVKDGDKVLSTNDYTNEEKSKLEGITEGAQVNVIEVVKVNGTALEVTDKAVDITIENPTYDTTIDENSTDNTAPSSKAVKTYVDTVKTSLDEIIETLDGKVNAIETWKLQVVEANENGLPNVSEISHKTIYLVPSTNSEDNNIYSEFVYIDNGSDDYWEKLGEFKSDFDPTGLNTAIEGLGTRIGTIETKLANYDTLVADVEKLKTTVGDDASGLVKDVNYLKDTVDGIVSEGGEANLVNDVTVDGTSIVVDKIAVLNTAKSATEGVEATGGLMSKEDKIKLDSLNFEVITNEDIENIVNGVTA